MIVLIESNPDEESLLVRALNSRGVDSCRVARAPEKALELLIEQQNERLPKLVLMDLDLPWTQAMEVVAKIRADRRTTLIPVIGITDSLNPCLAREAYLTGVSAVLVKPVDYDDYHHMINIACEFWLCMAVPAYTSLEQVGGSQPSMCQLRDLVPSAV